MKKRIAITIAVFACAVSVYFNMPNLRTIHAFAEIKNGAHIGYCHIVRELNYDVFVLGE